MEEERKPTSSTDPRDASFSYTFADRTDLWGPFCRECLTDWYDGNHFTDLNTHFYLHLKKCGKHYYLPELIAANGSRRPFDFRVIPDELRLLSCTHTKCKHTEKDRVVKETTSTGMQTLPLREEPPNPPVKTAPSKPASSSQSVASSDSGSVVELPKKGEILRILSKVNPPHVMERRPVEFPLLFGTCYSQSSKVNEELWILRTRLTVQIYDEMKDLAVQLREAFDRKGWKTEDCDVCPLIQPQQPYVEHVVSEYHRKNLYARGRWVTNGHFDMLDGFLRKQERVYRNQQRQRGTMSPPVVVTPAQDRPSTPPPTSASVLHYPLMSLWISRYPDQPKMSREEYNGKLDSIKEMLPLTNLKKLNEKYGANLDPKQNMCYLCDAKVTDLSDVIEHICSAIHRDRAFTKFHVTLQDLNQYANMLRAAAANKLPDRSSEATLSRTPSTSSLLSIGSSKASQKPSGASQKASGDPNAIRMPFMEGYDKVEQEMSRDEVVNVGIMTRGWFMDHPNFKKKLNEVVGKRGTAVTYCTVCAKNMPCPVAVVEHAMSTGHITQVISTKRRFCRVLDFCPLVTILLDANDMTHPVITQKNADTYFNMLKYSMSSEVQKQTVSVPQQQPAVATVVAEKKPQQNMPVQPQLVVEDMKVHNVPFYMGREKSKHQMTLEVCHYLTANLRKLMADNSGLKRNLREVVHSLGLKVFNCPRCENKKVVCPISMIDHAISTSHVNKLYEKGKTLCRLVDYVALVQMIARAYGYNATVTLENADQMLDRFGTMKISGVKPILAGNGASAPASARSSVSPEVQAPKKSPSPQPLMKVAVPPPVPVKEASPPVKLPPKEAPKNVVETEDLSPDDTVSEGSQLPGEETVVADEVEEREEKRDVTPETSTSADFDHPLCDDAVEATEENTHSSDDSDSRVTPTPVTVSPREEQPPRLKTCLLSPDGRALKFLHQPTKANYPSYLTEARIQTVSSKVFAAYASSRCLAVNVPCSTGDCSFIRAFCPTKCPVCNHSASCVCDYILHLFGSYHMKRIIAPDCALEPSHISFWLKVLKRLHPEIPFQCDIPPNDISLSDLTIGEYGIEKFDCAIHCNAFRPFKCMNKDSLVPQSRLTDEHLRLVGQIVSAYFAMSNKCFSTSAVSVLSKLMESITKVCPLCDHQSTCGCDYMRHLFRDAHIKELIRKKIAVSPADVQWWIDHIRYLCHNSKEFNDIDKYLDDTQLWRFAQVKPQFYKQEEFYIRGMPDMATSQRTMVTVGQVTAAQPTQPNEKKQEDCVIC